MVDKLTDQQRGIIRDAVRRQYPCFMQADGYTTLMCNPLEGGFFPLVVIQDGYKPIEDGGGVTRSAFEVSCDGGCRRHGRFTLNKV